MCATLRAMSSRVTGSSPVTGFGRTGRCIQLFSLTEGEPFGIIERAGQTSGQIERTGL